MTYIAPICLVLFVIAFVALFSPRTPKIAKTLRQVPQELGPGETVESLTADLEVAMADAVEQLDACVDYITRENWVGLSETETKKRVRARRRYIAALEAWRKAQECLQFDGTNGNYDLKMIGSIPLVRRAGIVKANQAAQQARELQEYIRSPQE